MESKNESSVIVPDILPEFYFCNAFFKNISLVISSKEVDVMSLPGVEV
jgi:hypothetical protein